MRTGTYLFLDSTSSAHFRAWRGGRKEKREGWGSQTDPVGSGVSSAAETRQKGRGGPQDPGPLVPRLGRGIVFSLLFRRGTGQVFPCPFYG